MRGARRPVLASILFFCVGPLLEAGVGPAVLTGWQRGDGALDSAPITVAGALAGLAALAVLLGAYGRFALQGRGTPSPLAPPPRLVARGAYRHVRHPMYLATAALIAAQGLVLARPVLLAGAAVYLAAMATLVWRVEEPALRRRHGAAHDAYAAHVPALVPRLVPRRGLDLDDAQR